MEVIGEFEELFPTVIGMYNLPQVDNELLVSHVNALRESNLRAFDNGSIYQSEGTIHEHEELTQLNNYVTKCVENYMDAHKYQYNKDKLYISNCWANQSSNLTVTHRSHIHRNTMLSAVYFVTAPEGSGSLYFPHSNPSAEMLRPETTELHRYNYLEYMVKPTPGKCVVFKSSTKHGVDQSFIENDDQRLTIAYTFNLRDIGEGSNFTKS